MSTHSSQRQATVIAPSILSANFAKLGEEVDNVLAAGADWVHFDVMDNHYVPNLTIGPMVCQALRKHGVTAPIDVHLMVQPVDALVPEFAKAGATTISFHPEASTHVHRTIQSIRDHGCSPGLVLNPATPLSVLDHVLGDIDLILVMTVEPGFGGQSFMAEQLEKIAEIRSLIDRSGRPIHLEVDGGIARDTAMRVRKAGANLLVAGSSVFREKGKLAEAISALRSAQ